MTTQQAMAQRTTFRVLILDNELHLGGTEKGLYDFIERVDRARFAVSVCCLKEGGYFKERLLNLGVPFRDGLLRHRYDAFAFRRLARLLREEEIDLVYTFAHPNTTILTAMARARGLVRRAVVAFHATGAANGGRLVPAWLRPFLGRMDALIALAEMHKRYLVDVERLRAERIEVIHDGVDTARFRPATAGERPALRHALGLGEGDVAVVAVGSLKRVKGQDVLLEAVAKHLPDVPPVRVLVVGDGPARAHLEADAARLGCADRVRFLGMRDDVESILRAADALVLPSRSEAFPNVVLEAMATALPAVVTDVGSVREMVEDGHSAFVVPKEDPMALGGALAHVIGDATLRARLGRRGREIVEDRFRIEQMCARREQLFERLLAR